MVTNSSLITEKSANPAKGTETSNYIDERSIHILKALRGEG